jgi:hypothetical protein
MKAARMCLQIKKKTQIEMNLKKGWVLADYDSEAKKVLAYEGSISG